MSFSHVKWLTVFGSLALFGLLEYIRHAYLERVYPHWALRPLALVTFILGAVLFFHYIFRIIGSMSRELTHEKDRLSALFNNTSDAIILVDEIGMVRGLNPAAESITGWSAQEVVDRMNCMDLLRCQDEEGNPLPAEECRSLGVIQSGRPIPYTELRIRSKSGRQAAVIMRDVGEKRSLERSLAILEERERLAREMHDGIAQTLGYLNLKLRAIETAVARGKTGEAEAGLEEAASVVSRLYDDVRQAIYDLRSDRVPGNDFLSALARYLRDFARQHGIGTELAVDAQSAVEIGDAARAQLTRIIQEALANVRKHSGASRVRVRLEMLPEGLRLAVEDDGSGFSPEEHQADAAAGTRHFGLSVMRERARLIGGRLEVQGVPGAGTTVAVTVPLERITE